jgi:TPR repeat protein
MKSLLIIPLVILSLLAPLNASADFGKGVAAYASGDYATAVKEFKKVAEQGDGFAQSILGSMYVEGIGVIQDDKEAVKWFRLAAEQGNARAQFNLGIMYDNVKGVIQDNAYADVWSNIAASEGHKNAKKNRDIIAKQMTPAQIAGAQKLARECVAKDYKGR